MRRIEVSWADNVEMVDSELREIPTQPQWRHRCPLHHKPDEVSNVRACVCVCVCAQQIKLAEVEQASLMSEQLSDKSSSLALPDDLSLDEHSNYQLLVRDSQVPPVLLVGVTSLSRSCR